MNSCLFLDRDGVINFDYGYVFQEEKFVFRKEIFKICKVAKDKNFLIIVITNQAGIGRGKYTEKDFLKINKFMKDVFFEKGIIIDDVYFCPFHPTEGKGFYLKDSFDRKPNPGLIFKAVADHNINLKDSIFIGDKETDRQAAESAGIPIYVDANKENWIDFSLNQIVRLSKN